MVLSISVLLGDRAARRLARAHRRARMSPTALVLLLLVRLGDDLGRHVDRHDGALARRGDGRRLHRGVPADVPQQRVRADRLAADAAVGRVVEPGQRDGRRGPRAVRQPGDAGGEARVADRAPGARLVPLLRAHPGDRRPGALRRYRARTSD